MKHILAVQEACNVATSQELEEDEEVDLPASGESAVQVCPATSLFFLGISQWWLYSLSHKRQSVCYYFVWIH